MDSIADLTPLAMQSPEEAAGAIKNATIFGTNPTDDKDTNKQLSSQADQLMKPTDAEPAVHDYMSQSPPHAALATPDVPQLNFMDKTAKYIGDIIYNRPTDNQKTIDLNLKKMENGGKLSDEDEYSLWQLNQSRDAQAQSDAATLADKKAHGYVDEPPSWPVQMGESIGDAALEAGRTARRNAPLIGAFTLGGAVAGGVPTAGVGAIPGAITGLGLGLEASFSIDGYDAGAGGTYNELSRMTKADGTPLNMDEGSKANISRGVGIASAAIMAVAGKAVVEGTPFLKTTMTPKLVAMAMQDPANAVLKLSLNNIGQAVSTMGAANAATTAVQIFGEEMAHTYDGSQTSFYNALKVTSEKLLAAGPLNEAKRRINESGAIGMATGLAYGVGANVLGVKSTQNQVENIAAQGRSLLADIRETRIGSPAGLITDGSPNPDRGPSVGDGEPPRPPPKDVTPKAKAPVEPENSVQQAVKVLKFQDAMNDVTDVAKSTKMNDLAPGEMTSMVQRIFERAGISKLYTTWQAARDWATSDEKGAAIRDALGHPMKPVQENTPVEVDPVKIATIAKTDPSIWEKLQITPEGPNPAQARTHLENLQKAESDRQVMLAKMGIMPKDVVHDDAAAIVNPEAPAPFDVEHAVRRTGEILNQMASPDIKDADKADLHTELQGIKAKAVEHLRSLDPKGHLIPQFGPWPEKTPTDVAKAMHDYLNQMSIPEAIKQVLPKAHVDQLEAATRRAREDNADHIIETAANDAAQREDDVVQIAKETRLEQELAAIAHDPHFALVDRVLNSKAMTVGGKKQISIYAIDPKTLPDHLLKYLDNPQLKKHKIFQKGGGDADNIAQLLGLKDGDEFLSILSTTPTREVVAKARAFANEAADEVKARASVDVDRNRIVDVIDNKVNNVIQQMKFMLDQEWPSLKGAITKIALTLPKSAEWNQIARDTVKQTATGSLNPRIYQVAERRAHVAAVKAIVKGEILKAYEHLGERGQALANLKEALLMAKEVKKAKEFMRDFSNKGTQSILKYAGKTIFEASQDINNLFNFNPKAKQQTDMAAYIKWVKREVTAGRGNFELAPQFMDTRQSVKEMTVEGLLAVTDKARVILKAAKEKGQVLDSLNALKEKRSLDRFEAQVKEKALAHPGSKASRLPEVQEKLPNRLDRFAGFFSSAEELIASKQNIVREMDQGNTGGFFHKELEAPMEGSGKYFEKMGHTYEKKFNKWLDTNIRRLNAAHGDVASFENKIIYVPEFKGIKELRNGRLTKGDIATAWANRGQAYTKDMLFENTGGVTDEVWQKVFDKHLSKKDVEYVQGAVDLYKDPAIRAKTTELQEAQGQEVTFIEGIPNVHQGVTYAGGYIRVRTKQPFSEGEIKQALEELQGKAAAHYEPDEGGNWGRQYAAETTDQGYLESRVGNDKPLNLALNTIFDGLREIGHDHAYRTPLMDFFNKMKRKDVRDSLVAMVGQKKVNTLISNNLEIAGRPSAKETGYFANPNTNIKNIIQKAGNKFAVYTIWANWHATKIQAEALPQMFNALGPKAMMHFAQVNWTMLTNPTKLYGFIDAARDLDPAISKYIDNVNDSTMQVLNDLVPRKSDGISKTIIGRAEHFITLAGFFPHQMLDLYLKVAGAHTVVKHVMAGDHPLYPKAKIDAMTPEEQWQTVQGIVQQTSTLIHLQSRHELKAPIQKNLAMSPWAVFWNYPRNIINNTLIDNRRFMWKTQEGIAKLKSGGSGGGGRDGIQTRYQASGDEGPKRDYTGAAKDFGSATSILMTSQLWRTIGGLYLMAISAQGIGNLVKKNMDWSNAKDLEEEGMHLLGKIMEASQDYLVHSTPIASGMEYAATHKRRYQEADVKNPQTQQLSSLAECLSQVPNILYLAKHPNSIQLKACLETGGFVFSPAIAKGFKLAMDWENSPTKHANVSQMDKINKEIDAFIKDPGEAPKELVAQAEALHSQLAPQVVKVPDETRDIVKMAESGGKWDSENGLYGFTSSQWSSIMKSAPDLGLTDAGRLAKDSTQQEKAMDWSLHDNAAKLAGKDLPVNSQTLLASHVLGVNNYEKILEVPSDTKTKKVLSEEVLKEHPDLANFKTIGQVKSYFNNKVEEGRKATKDLTTSTE